MAKPAGTFRAIEAYQSPLMCGGLVTFAGVFGITNEEINVWVFVFIWPILTLVWIALMIR
jgi:hypothetical protein